VKADAVQSDMCRRGAAIGDIGECRSGQLHASSTHQRRSAQHAARRIRSAALSRFSFALMFDRYVWMVSTLTCSCAAMALEFMPRLFRSKTSMVIDDGVGIQHRVPNQNGIGLRIMRHRATSIGSVSSAGPGIDRGTVVTCALPAAPHVES
jgi:two-component sensor histidine kinase